MTDFESILNNAYSMLRMYLKSIDKNNRTHNDVVAAAKEVCSLRQFKEYDYFLIKKLVDKYEENTSIKGFNPEVLSVDSNDDWFEKKKNVIETNFFDRYTDYLVEENFAEDSIEKIKLSTELILSKCADPVNCGPNGNKKKGLVVGDVQSGKTANYLALINMACDFGYKTIIVLAGMTNSLRIQTQKRLDRGVVGIERNPQNDEVLYVGVGEDTQKNYAVSITNLGYDFNKVVKDVYNAGENDFNKPRVMVVKKNTNVLEHITKYLTANEEKLNMENVLIIDDEADNASVNTKKDEASPSKINDCIRTIFNNFKIATYVGFTATPFANIFIDPQLGTGEEITKLDLFPSDFIVQLKAPTDYFGAKEVFENDRVVRILGENEYGFLPTKHKKDYDYTGIPKTMKEAINSFIIDNALRSLDGYSKKHRSMLINISVYNNLHRKIKDYVDDYLNDARNVFLQDRYKNDEDFIKNDIANSIYELYTNDDFYNNDKALGSYNWNTVRKAIEKELPLIESIVFNSVTQRNFDYDNYKEGARIIAIGGYVLSRGLTLEGLMVSYYNRASKTYDTMLQMCRWFGYRQKYDHLCRVYMTGENKECFLSVIDAINDLRVQFTNLILSGGTPSDFGLMVKESPEVLNTTLLEKYQKVLDSSLTATSSNKRRKTYVIEQVLDYAGVVCDTSKLSSNVNLNGNNEIAIKAFIDTQLSMGKSIEKGGEYYNLIRDVSKKDICYLLQDINVSLANVKFAKEAILDHLNEANSGLDKWDVVIASGQSDRTFKYNDIEVPCCKRSFILTSGIIRIGGNNNRVVDPGIFKIGLSDNQIAQANEKANEMYITGKRKSKNLIANDLLSVDGRKPMFVIYPLELLPKECEENDDNEKLNKVMNKIGNQIVYAFAIGFPAVGSKIKVMYRLNEVKYKNMMKELNRELEEEDEYEFND